MNKKIFFISLLLFSLAFVFGRIHIHTGAEANLANDAELNISGDWVNNGAFSSGTGTLNFIYTGTFSGSSANYFYNAVIDADYLLDSEVHITGNLYLKSGILDSALRRNLTLKTNIPDTAGKKNRTRKIELADNMLSERNRTGSLYLENDVYLIRNVGSLAFSPNVTSRLNLMYLSSALTGLEVPSESSVLQNLVVYAPGGTVTLAENITVNDTLKIVSGSVNTDSFDLNITASALIDAYPTDITGNLVAESVAVGTSSYTNSAHGLYVSAGNDIGSIRSLVFLKPVALGSTEGIGGFWRIESDTDPVGRDLSLYWSAVNDNGVDNLNIQTYKSIDEGSSWYQTGQTTASSTDPRSIVVDDIASFSDWTVAEPHFSFDVDELDFDVIGVGNSATMQFTLTNEKAEVISGSIYAPSGFSVAEATSRITTYNITSVNNSSLIASNNEYSKRNAGNDVSLDAETNPATQRNTIMFSIPASTSVDYEVTFSPSANIAYEDYVVVQQSAAGSPSRILTVIGTGINLPNIEASPLSFSDILAEGESSAFNLNIADTGDVDLVYSASMLYTTGVRDALIVSPQRTDYYTGTCTSGEKISTSESRVRGGADGTQENAWMKFDVSTIPDAAVITSVHLRCYSTDTNYPYWSITPVAIDPGTADAASLNIDIKAEEEVGYYVRIQTNDTVLGWKDYELLGTANTDLQTALTQNWFALGLPSRDGSTNYFIEIDGWNETHPPYLEVEYTLSQTESWLSLDSAASVSGTVPAGTSADVSVGMDATGLADGDYSASILLTSNDLSEPTINIPVNLTVGEPIIDVSVSQLAFGDVETGQTATLQFTLENTGSLLLTGDITTPANFSINYATRSNDTGVLSKQVKEKALEPNRNTIPYGLEPGISQIFDVTFYPTAATTYDDNIVITHNAAGLDELINVTGTGTAPTLTYNPGSFDETLEPDGTNSQIFNVGNTGTADLDYNISISHFTRNVLTSEKDPVVIYNPYDYPAPTRQGGEDVATALEITALPYNDSGTTAGYLNDYDEVCPYTGSTAPDVVYVYTPAADAVVDISLCNGSTYDTKLYVYENDAIEGTAIACNDDSCPNYVSELLDVSLTAGNDYYIVVDGYGGASGAYVLDVTEFAEVTEHCTTSYSNLTDDYISNVALNTINNSSGSLGYEDFTAISTDLVIGDSYDIYVDITVNGTYTQHCKVWIDWNQDFVFDPAAEEYDLGETLGTGQLTASIAVPIDAVLGTTRMRVAEMYATDPEPCTIYTYGEAEDYTINVGELITDNWLAVNGTSFVSATIIPSAPDDALSVDFDAAGLPEGIYTATLNLTCNDSQLPLVYIPVQLTVQNPPIIYVSETSLNFGNVEAGTTSVLQFYIENTGAGTLEGDITTPAGYSAAETVVMAATSRKPAKDSKQTTTRNVLAYSVAVGNTVYYDVTFAPTEAVTYSGNVDISHNAAGGNNLISVTGVGVVADIEVNPLFFDKLMIVETTTTDDLLITANGSADLDVSLTIAYNEPETGWLTLNGNQTAAGTVPFGYSGAVTVGFDTTTLGAGLYSADINIASNDPDEPIVSVPVTLEVLSELSTPENVIISILPTEVAIDVTIEWDAVYGATSYTVYRTANPYNTFPDDWTAVTGITETFWDYTTDRNKRYYRVTASRD